MVRKISTNFQNITLNALQDYDDTDPEWKSYTMIQDLLATKKMEGREIERKDIDTRSHCTNLNRKIHAARNENDYYDTYANVIMKFMWRVWSYVILSFFSLMFIKKITRNVSELIWRKRRKLIGSVIKFIIK